MDEAKLIGWLCFWSYQPDQQVHAMPEAIRDELAQRGWLEVHALDLEAGIDAGWASKISDAGQAVVDLNCAEWGIDPMPVEETP